MNVTVSTCWCLNHVQKEHPWHVIFFLLLPVNSTQIFERIAVNAWKRMLAFIKKIWGTVNYASSYLIHTHASHSGKFPNNSHKNWSLQLKSSVTWFNSRLGSARLKVGLDLRGLLQPKCFYDPRNVPFQTTLMHFQFENSNSQVMAFMTSLTEFVPQQSWDTWMLSTQRIRESMHFFTCYV